MKTSLLFILLVFSLQLPAQNNLMFDTAQVDAATKLIGRYPHYDKQKTYRYLNFIIEDSITIKKIITTLSLGEKDQNIIMDPSFRISIIQDFRERESWTVNPTLNNAMFGGHTYKLSINKIKRIAKKYPFEYTFERVIFNSKEEYENYLNKQKQNKAFLFNYAPSFKYEGSFDIQFPRTQKFSSPKAISDYLSPLIEKIVPKGDYLIGYAPNEKNTKDLNQYSITITGSKKIYDALQLDNLQKKKWEPTVEDGYFFYKTE